MQFHVQSARADVFALKNAGGDNHGRSPPTSATISVKEPIRTIFILSAKSSGSSAIQQRITALSGARTLPHTTHWENETLYWTKAASVLRLPQFRLPNSEVPIAAPKASAQLHRLLRANLPEFAGALVADSNFFEAWSQLARRYRPILLEKSPHHLYQPAVLELMERYADAANDISVSFIGLVRNPIATMYSSWRRFGTSPHMEEPHWIRAYRALAALSKRRSDLVAVVRYEDLVVSDRALVTALRLEHSTHGGPVQANLRGGSVEKWKSDRKFGYRPTAEAIAVARAYGYTESEVTNPNAGPWFVHRLKRTATYGALERLPSPMRDPIRSVAARLRGAASLSYSR